MRSIDPALVATEWQHRCEMFAARNRAWVISASVWLLATIALGAAAFLLQGNGLLYGFGAALLFIFGMPAFQIASLGLNRILNCPSCGERAMPRKLFGAPDPATVQTCSNCGCRLQPNNGA